MIRPAADNAAAEHAATTTAVAPAKRRVAARLAGLGVANPEHPLTVEAAVELADKFCCETPKQRRLLEALARRSGVTSRRTCIPSTAADVWLGREKGPTTRERMALYEAHAAPLALESAAAALADGGVSAERVTHLVTVSCTGFEAPGVDCTLIDRLGLAATTERVNVGFMGCHGAINGLRVARGLAAAEPEAVVLLVATELCSLHYCFHWAPEQLVGNTLFADGSAAVVLLGEDAPGDLPDDALSVTGTGSTVLPDSAELMTWRVGDHGFEMTLDAALPGLVEEQLPLWLPAWLERHGVALADVASWAVHPGGPKIVTAVERALGIDPSQTEVSREVLREHGNMSSATVLFLLNRLRKEGAGGPLVMLGFGPGIVAEVALWE